MGRLPFDPRPTQVLRVNAHALIRLLFVVWIALEERLVKFLARVLFLIFSSISPDIPIELFFPFPN